MQNGEMALLSISPGDHGLLSLCESVGRSRQPPVYNRVTAVFSENRVSLGLG